MRKYPHNLIVDTGFWIAYYEPRDTYHEQAIKKASLFDRANILLAWPVLYETLNTRFVRRPNYVRDLENVVRRPGVEILDDTPFRERAYTLTLKEALRGKRPLSLTDTIIRLMLESPNIKTDYILTFNIKDYCDICAKRSIIIA